MLKLTKEDYEQILQDLGSSQEPFNSEKEFIEWVGANSLDGQQYAEIESYLNDKFGTSEKIYNKKEGRRATANSFQRLRDWVLGGETPVNNEPAPEPEPVPEPPAPEPVADESMEINYRSLMDEAKYFMSAKNPTFKEDDNIDCTGNNVHFKGRNIIVEDGIGLVDFNNEIYSDNLIVILNNKNTVVAVGCLNRCGDDFRVVTDADATVKDSWGNNNKFRILIFPKNIDNYLSENRYREIFEEDGIIEKIRYVSIQIREDNYEISESPLCIDFGTSNTTAGYFTDEKDDERRFKRISFVNTLEKNFTLSEIYPTLLYVKHCDNENPANNVYLFGFDARKELIAHDYMPDASIFFELKRWFGIDPEKKIHITDEDSNEAVVTYYMLIKAYLMHIIQKAENDSKRKFNRIHFTAPVKLKAIFINQFKKMFSDADFTVEGAGGSLDEGISVIYETIRNNIRTGNDFDNTNLMVIDCGGGTTDVASCEIEREKNNGIEELKIRTCYVGGEANFGGNNITYRIMQLIKVKLAFYYQKETGSSFNGGYSVFLKEILPAPEDILNFIDADKNTSRVYKKLEEEYNTAESLIPTRFEEENDLTKYRKKKNKIRRNFYYLWNLAETIKTEFYKKEQLTLIGFNKLSEPSMDENYENILDESELNFSIYIRNGKELEERVNLPQISVTAQEVDDLIRGDIYSLLSRIFYNNENTGYRFYRFSGQSCKIRLFSELMKEFIPGKKLRDVTKTLNKADAENKSSEKLKTSCIKGTVYYEYDTKHGNINPYLANEKPRIEFKVLTEFNGNYETVLDSESIRLFPIPDGTEYISLNIKDKFDVFTNRCTVSLTEETKTSDTGKIAEILEKRTLPIYKEKIMQLIADADNGRYCFIYPGKLGFELYAVTLKIGRTDEKSVYTISSSHLVPVEDSSQTFFDGNK